MMRMNRKVLLFASTALAVSFVAESAFAGAFALREQSSYYQGFSFAGYGTTGGGISAMYWNPAALMGAGHGMTFEAHNSLIVPVSDVNGTLSGGVFGSSSVSGGDIGADAFIPASYSAYRLNEHLIFGMGVNAPFGLSTKPESQNWAAQFYSRSSSIFSLNVNPAVAYQFNDKIAIAVGAQIQYLKVGLKSADATSGAGFPRSNDLSGDDISFGVTAGITIRPWKGGEIGIGYRSAIGHDLEGYLIASGVRSDVTVGAVLPEMINISARQNVTDKFRVMGTVEWTNWSRLKSPRVISNANGSTLNTLHFNYDDGWFFSVGGEYDFNDKLSFRAGLGYEISPIDEDIRSTRLPDNNRWWLSAGASYNLSDHLTFDLGFTHIIPEATKINIDANHQDYNALFGTYTADVDSHVNILTASVRYTF